MTLLLCLCVSIDVDECAVGNGGCQYACENTPGSFICTCPPGYQLASDFRHCQGILATLCYQGQLSLLSLEGR